MQTDSTSPPAKSTYIAAIALLVFALLAVSIRIALKHEDGLPAGDSAWTISISHEIEAMDKGALVYVPPPWDTRYARLFAQSLSHSGMRQQRSKSGNNKRDIILVAPNSGYYSIETVFSVHVSSLARSDPKKSGLSEQNRADWLAASTGVSINTPATLEIVDRLSQGDILPGELIAKLFDYVSNHIRIDKRASSDSAAALTENRGSIIGSNRALLALLRTAHLPARIVTGVNLQAPVNQQPFYWVEVYDEEVWQPLDPVHGYMNELPPFYIPLRKGDNELIKAENAHVSGTEWKITTARAPRGLLSSESKKLTDIFDLNRLSPSSRENLGVLLLLPLGALATEIMRQIGGIRTYGTFTPTLLALAIVHVDWFTAMIVFLLVTTIGVASRATLPNLNLQRTPRLAIVFTLVSLFMAIVISGFIYIDPGMDSIVVLLPVVVLTMLVDRIYTVADESGMHAAMIRLFWTLVSAAISIAILVQTHWGAWLVTYPEIHAITLATVILIGLYKGPKLRDLAALGWLHEPVERKRRLAKTPVQSRQSDDSV